MNQYNLPSFRQKPMSKGQPSRSPRPLPVWVTIAFALLVHISAHAQAVGVRVEIGSIFSAGVVTVTAQSGYPPLYAVPNATVILCSYPATGSPCTNPVSTYTDLTLNTQCPSNQQIVLQGTSSCVATTDATGAGGFYIAAGGTYSESLVINGVPYGPYTISVGVSGTASTPVTTPVSCPTSSTFQITSTNQAFAVGLTGNCTAGTLTASGAITPPALVVFQITQPAGGGDTFSWPSNSVGGCVIASGSNAVTVQAFNWNGATATAIGSCNQGGGVESAPVYNATTGFQCNGSGGSAGQFLESTGSACAWGSPFNGFTLANAASTGTTINTLTIQTGAPSTAVIAATTTTNGIIGIASAGAGTSGNATISTSGQVLCHFDGATTANDWVIASTSTGGYCHDSGLAPPSLPPNNTELLGQTLSTQVGAGTYSMNFYGPGLIPPSLTPNFTSLACTVVTKTSAYQLTANDCIVQATLSSAGFALTLPHALTGQLWTITRTDASAHALTIAGDTGDVNGQASISIGPYSSAYCHADGTNSWCVISVSANGLLIQYGTDAACTGNGCSAETFPIPYQSAVPTCFCTGINGSCNLQTAGAAKTGCSYNASASGGINWLAVGVP